MGCSRRGTPGLVTGVGWEDGCPGDEQAEPWPQQPLIVLSGAHKLGGTPRVYPSLSSADMTVTPLWGKELEARKQPDSGGEGRGGRSPGFNHNSLLLPIKISVFASVSTAECSSTQNINRHFPQSA